MVIPVIAPNSSNIGKTNAVPLTSRIVESRYKNCAQVCHGFGALPSDVRSDGFAVPENSIISFEKFRALASIAERTSSFSYIEPLQLVKIGV